MRAVRFISVSAAALLAAAPAFAQANPAAGSVKDIEVSRDGDKVSILIQLSQQPASADADVSSEGLALNIDGVDLIKLQIDPPDGSLVNHVEAAGQKITLSGAAFSSPSTTIYRNAVLVEAKLADPPARGTSLMPVKATTPAAPVAVASAPVTPAAATTPAAPAAAKPAPTQQLAPKPAATAPAGDDHLESKPVVVKSAKPVAPKVEQADPAAFAGTAELAGLNAQACAVALGDLDDDPWSTDALGNHALCLLDQGKAKEAANRLDQLAAFAPEDWRVSLGHALIAEKKGDASNAVIAFKAAAQLAPDDNVRAAIADYIAKITAH